MASPARTRRKLAIATWRAPREPVIHGRITLDATAALSYLDWVRETTGERATMTHLVGRAVGAALAAEPSLNVRLRLGRFVPREDVSVAFLVQVGQGAELTRARIRDVDRRPVAEIAAELRGRADRLRGGRDPDWERNQQVVRTLPTWLLRPVLWVVGWLGGALGLEIPALGVRPFPFGSAIVTSVGMLGLDEAYVPPTPFARVPLYVLVGAVRERPAVVDGQVAVRPQVTITATLDHRFLDGYQAGALARAFRRVLTDPWSLHPPDERPAPDERPVPTSPAPAGRPDPAPPA